MSDDYLWDSRARPVDPFVAELEAALESKRYSPSARLPKAGSVAVATLMAAAAGLVLWLAFRAPAGGGPAEPALADGIPTEKVVPLDSSERGVDGLDVDSTRGGRGRAANIETATK